MARDCSVCGKNAGFLSSVTFVNINGKEYCAGCAQKHINDSISGIVITTTNNIDNHPVKEYIDIESVEIVVGTGIFSEFGGDVSDFFGARSTGFEKKLQNAKVTALKKLKYLAYQKGGNAVLGIDLDYTEFSGNRIGLIANGTIVKI
jgi:uncharacterized protein YbjQ (UPF0145 family)